MNRSDVLLADGRGSLVWRPIIWSWGGWPCAEYFSAIRIDFCIGRRNERIPHHHDFILSNKRRRRIGPSQFLLTALIKCISRDLVVWGPACSIPG